MTIDAPATLTVKTTEGMRRIVIDALVEVERSTEKHGDQRHRPIGTEPTVFAPLRDNAQMVVDSGLADGSATWTQIISEEMFEAFAEAEPEAVRAELVQVLAVVIKAIDAIDAATP